MSCNLKKTAVNENNPIASKKADLKITYISGAAGTGKSTSILNNHDVSGLFRTTNPAKPFEGYTGESVVVFDDFRSSCLKFSKLMEYTNSVNKHYDTMYIVSCLPLEDQYKDIQRKHPKRWKEFLNRICSVHIHNTDSSVDIYDSVTDYLDRK